jgi:hypothetical protein
MCYSYIVAYVCAVLVVTFLSCRNLSNKKADGIWTLTKKQSDVYNNQLHALFILSLLDWRTSTCFGCINSPSSGGIVCICGNWYYASKLTISRPPSPADGQLRSIVPIATYTYTHYTSRWWAVDTPETCRGASIQYKRINSASSWLLYI